jgi:hypothetical protein
MCVKVSIIATLKRLGTLIRCRKDNVKHFALHKPSNWVDAR